MATKKVKNKWIACCGCYASFDNKGILNIFLNLPMYKMVRSSQVQSFIILGEQEMGKKKGLVISNDHVNVGWIDKKHCKVI